MRKFSFVAVVLSVVWCSGLFAQGTIGPDVTVSNTGSIQLWGEVNGIAGYSAASTSCNRGDAIAEWEADDNTHPLIGSQMYRVDAQGRLDLIGISWLKHSFCAVNENSCGNCQDTPCPTLGIGCADTYGTGLNGQQTNLGPRYDVNAATGAYNYPFPTQGEAGDAIYKRLQIRTTDLDPTLNVGARYFNEVVYITTDEQAWNNQFNNTSYREASTNGSVGANGGFNVDYSGPLVEQATGLDAWQAAVPSVVIEDIMVPNDGLIKFAYNVTDLGGGQWRYDYVAYNYNSDRSIGAVAIPVPGGVTTSSLYFNDVDYHSGEPYSLADWAVTNANGALTWSTESFATNQNANAIRWSTAYTFSFVADSAPTNATATLSLFKPGSPVFVTAPILAPETSVIAAEFTASPSTGGSPLVTTFINNSSGNIDTYLWDFGDGDTSTEPNPTHIYLNEGLYTVSLTVTGATGTDTRVRTDYIDVGPAIHTAEIAPTNAFAGATLTVPVIGGSNEFRQGYALALSYPADLLTAVDFSIAGTDAASAEFAAVQLDDVSGTMTLEVFMTDPPAGATNLPAGFGQNLGNLIFDVDGTFIDGETRTLSFSDGVGAVPVNNVYIDLQGNVIPVATSDGEVTFLNQISFIRGNCDGVGQINLIDALRVLNIIFAGAAQPSCLKACDVDDSGQLNLLDGIDLLRFLFAGGSPPVAPFPALGVDTTPDTLPCTP